MPRKLFKIMVGERGFEPPTPWSRTRCSTRLSHSPTWCVERTPGAAWRGDSPRVRWVQFSRSNGVWLLGGRRKLPLMARKPVVAEGGFTALGAGDGCRPPRPRGPCYFFSSTSTYSASITPSSFFCSASPAPPLAPPELPSEGPLEAVAELALYMASAIL